MRGRTVPPGSQRLWQGGAVSSKRKWTLYFKNGLNATAQAVAPSRPPWTAGAFSCKPKGFRSEISRNRCGRRLGRRTCAVSIRLRQSVRRYLPKWASLVRGAQAAAYRDSAIMPQDGLNRSTCPGFGLNWTAAKPSEQVRIRPIFWSAGQRAG